MKRFITLITTKRSKTSKRLTGCIRLTRRVRQARPVGDLTIAQLSALTSLELAGLMTPRELADVERVAAAGPRCRRLGRSPAST